VTSFPSVPRPSAMLLLTREMSLIVAVARS
jgi:hypothetical protein